MIKVKDKEELREIIEERKEKSVKNKTYTIDVGDLDVSKVEDMSCLFCGFISLEEIKGLENWDVSNVEDMSCMFSNCSNLKEIKGLENWNTSKVKDMRNMFWCCKQLEEIRKFENKNH